MASKYSLCKENTTFCDGIPATDATPLLAATQWLLQPPPAIVIQGPLHDQLLVEAKDSPAQLQLITAALLCLEGKEDLGSVAYHHPHSWLESSTHVAGVVTFVVDDHFPRLEGRGGGCTNCRGGVQGLLNGVRYIMTKL